MRCLPFYCFSTGEGQSQQQRSTPLCQRQSDSMCPRPAVSTTRWCPPACPHVTSRETLHVCIYCIGCAWRGSGWVGEGGWGEGLTLCTQKKKNPRADLAHGKTTRGKFSVETIFLRVISDFPGGEMSSSPDLDKPKPSALWNGAWTQRALDTYRVVDTSGLGHI